MYLKKKDFSGSQHVQSGVIRKEPPAYGQRKGWIPRSVDDYGDGGAFPEIHIAQYPLNMGKKKTTTVSLKVQGRKKKTVFFFSLQASSKAVVPLQLDSTGKVKYDAIAKMGQRKDKVVHTSLQAMTPQNRPTDPELMRPDEEEIEKVRERERERERER